MHFQLTSQPLYLVLPKGPVLILLSQTNSISYQISPVYLNHFLHVIFHVYRIRKCLYILVQKEIRSLLFYLLLLYSPFFCCYLFSKIIIFPLYYLTCLYIDRMTSSPKRYPLNCRIRLVLFSLAQFLGWDPTQGTVSGNRKWLHGYHNRAP